MTTSLALCRNCNRRDAVKVAITGDGDEWPYCEHCGPPAAFVARRNLDSEEVESFTGDRKPLTVKEAAERENASERTVYRWLPELEADDSGAWRVGTHWRIDPAALDRRRARGPRPRKPTKAKPAAVPSRRKASNPVAWPK